MTTTDPDEVLIARAKDDPAAFGVLYERHVTTIYNYVFYRVSNVAEAEDLTAKVFYQALTHLDSYVQRGTPFVAWLFRIAHNLIANWYRDKQNRRTFSLDNAVLERDSDEKAEPLSHGAEHEEEVRELRAVLKGLPADRQQLIVLKYVAGMSNAQIGVIMGRSEGAIKAMLHRTLLSLRAELTKSAGRDRPADARSGR